MDVTKSVFGLDRELQENRVVGEVEELGGELNEVDEDKDPSYDGEDATHESVVEVSISAKVDDVWGFVNVNFSYFVGERLHICYNYVFL